MLNGIRFISKIKNIYAIPRNLRTLTKTYKKNLFFKKNVKVNNFAKPKILFSKKSWQKYKLLNVYNIKFKTTLPSITLAYTFSLQAKKIYVLNYSSLNYWFYTTFTNKTLFKYNKFKTYYNNNRVGKGFNFSDLGFFTRINMLVTDIEAKPSQSIVYARAWNSRAKVLNVNFKFLSLLLLLPSKKYKVLSLFVRFVYHDSRLNSTNTLYSINTYKKSKLLNKSQSVRGIAMNPVDHPHGGRAKAIKSPKTPWGLTAKRGK